MDHHTYSGAIVLLALLPILPLALFLRRKSQAGRRVIPAAAVASLLLAAAGAAAAFGSHAF